MRRKLVLKKVVDVGLQISVCVSITLYSFSVSSVCGLIFTEGAKPDMFIYFVFIDKDAQRVGRVADVIYLNPDIHCGSINS